MAAPRIDYRAVFAVTPSPNLLLTPDFVAVDVNDAYLRVTGRTREELVGRDIFDVHPDNPDNPDADGVRNLQASLRRVLHSKRPDTMAVQRYDIPAPGGQQRRFVSKWWSPINIPVLAPDGSVRCIIHRVEDMTDFMESQQDDPGTSGVPVEGMEAELYTRGQELQRFNDELRVAHARERQIALTLQQAMLHSPDLAGHREIALRYMPAVRSMNVCGDWYDVVDLSEDTFTVAVGDVVGHGLEAAAIMGMLRSALSAAVRAIPEPGRAMDVLGRYARTFDSALATTAAKAVVDTRARRITYTSAGHPPPLLCGTDGSVAVLDKATDPPLGVRMDDGPRPQATVPYRPGATLVLYTDGLIERRGEDIDTGLQRLVDTLAAHSSLGPDALADTLLSRLGVPNGGLDDIALIVVRL
ncbi:PP2C family protein-serine/threonine phosphatase [Actinacidiphila epipremni]|uniref:SpoIIE family protein phosphatase n=1 Tax=Actinacidiphila epipremni TaxID=2053013 RepID=A0ABX0ZVY1_9ACTN|nr:SpoIIE family protein phosphatase [Actinacidiphila epipremni]NJP45766.1 SpoIIE family protein phosphatase [Actinacidiphila epipremni]